MMKVKIKIKSANVPDNVIGEKYRKKTVDDAKPDRTVLNKGDVVELPVSFIEKHLPLGKYCVPYRKPEPEPEEEEEDEEDEEPEEESEEEEEQKEEEEDEEEDNSVSLEDLKEMNKEEMETFIEKKNLDIKVGRKGEKRLAEEIWEALD